MACDFFLKTVFEFIIINLQNMRAMSIYVAGSFVFPRNPSVWDVRLRTFAKNANSSGV